MKGSNEEEHNDTVEEPERLFQLQEANLDRVGRDRIGKPFWVISPCATLSFGRKSILIDSCLSPFRLLEKRLLLKKNIKRCHNPSRTEMDILQGPW